MRKLLKKICWFFLVSLIFFVKNLSSTLLFHNKTALINLHYSNSDFIIEPSSFNLDASFKNGFNIPAGQTIILNTKIPISGLLDLSGTLSLENDLYCDTKLTYSGIGSIAGNGCALHLGGNLIIPASNVLHIGSDTAIEGHGNTIILGDSAELFVDDNVTLTLRNVLVCNTKNFVGNPAIKLASHRSKLALDNASLDIIGDFYFDCGQLFVHNDVSFTGTSAFVYCSPKPSFITSHSTLNFDLETIFDFRPSTTGTPELLAKDLLFMQDATSQLYLNGCTLKTTLTGMRLTKGQLTFDNKVTMTSNAELYLTEFYNSGNPVATVAGYGNSITNLSWSPDGRFIAIGGNNTPGSINVYSFSGNSLTLTTTSESYGNHIRTLAWSPDGRFIAIGGWSSPGTVKVYFFLGNNLPQVATSASYGGNIRALSWSPDGRYIAVGGDTAQVIKVYQFTGNSLTLVATSAVYGGTIRTLSWSSDGRYIVTGGETTQTVNVYNFSGNSLTSVAQSGAYGGTIYSLGWSPDGKYIAVTGGVTTNALYIYNFTGNRLVLVQTANYGNELWDVSWSPDGKYIAIGGSSPYTVNVYRFSDGSLTLIDTSASYGDIISKLSWNPDGRYIAVCGNPTNTLNVYALRHTSSSSQILSNSIVFGNSALGSSYDLNVRGLSGAKIEIDGLLNYDNVS